MSKVTYTNKKKMRQREQKWKNSANSTSNQNVYACAFFWNEAFLNRVWGGKVGAQRIWRPKEVSNTRKSWGHHGKCFKFRQDGGSHINLKPHFLIHFVPWDEVGTLSKHHFINLFRVMAEAITILHVQIININVSPTVSSLHAVFNIWKHHHLLLRAQWFCLDLHLNW